jgi:hypothetical protein
VRRFALRVPLSRSANARRGVELLVLVFFSVYQRNRSTPPASNFPLMRMKRVIDALVVAALIGVCFVVADLVQSLLNSERGGASGQTKIHGQRADITARRDEREHKRYVRRIQFSLQRFARDTDHPYETRPRVITFPRRFANWLESARIQNRAANLSNYFLST